MTFGGRSRTSRDRPLSGLTGMLADMDESVRCATCGRAFDGDPDEDAFGENDQPLCGPCNRARNFDVELDELRDEGDEGDDRGLR